MANYDARVFTGTDLGKVSGVVSSLPAGYVLGEERWENGIKYRLVFNAGNSQINPGFCASPVPLNAGPYSLTISTASKTYCNIGAVVVHNATATTGTYFWGAVRGYLASGVVCDAVTAATGAMIYVSLNGNLNAVVTPTSLVSGNLPVGLSLNGPTAGTVAVRQGSVMLTIE